MTFTDVHMDRQKLDVILGIKVVQVNWVPWQEDFTASRPDSRVSMVELEQHQDAIIIVTRYLR